MVEQKFDGLLADLTSQRVPDLPGSFSHNVLREIRLRREEESGAWFGALLQMWLLPRTFAVAIAAAVAVGLVLPLAVTAGSNTSMAVRGLDLNVFSSAASNLPSGLLSRVP